MHVSAGQLRITTNITSNSAGKQSGQTFESRNDLSDNIWTQMKHTLPSNSDSKLSKDADTFTIGSLDYSVTYCRPNKIEIRSNEEFLNCFAGSDIDQTTWRTYDEDEKSAERIVRETVPTYPVGLNRNHCDVVETTDMYVGLIINVTVQIYFIIDNMAIVKEIYRYIWI